MKQKSKLSKNKVLVIGLTGGFGTGKTTVANMLSSRKDVRSVNADKLAHACLRKKAVVSKIINSFGKDILDKKGRIDRARLSDAAFKEASSIKRLSNIIHPSVIKQIKQIIRKAHTCEKPKIVIIDAPLLIEARLHNICDIVIVVKTSRATQIRRIKKKMRISTEQIMARIKNQLPLKNKIRYADYVIDNSGPEVDTNKSVNALYDKIKKSAT